MGAFGGSKQTKETNAQTDVQKDGRRDNQKDQWMEGRTYTARHTNTGMDRA